MSTVDLIRPVREYINALVHSSARGDILTAARHRNFIAPRVVGGLVALALLPAYLVARGGLSLLEAAVFGWCVVPLAIAWWLSRTGRYAAAQIAWSAAFTVLIVTVAAAGGGLASPAAPWLALVPVEAALAASRRIVVAAAAVALAAAGLLLGLGDSGLAVLPPAPESSMGLTALSIAGAALYAALMALGAGSLARTGSALLSEEERRYRFLALNMTDVISRHGRGGIVLFASPAADKLFGAPAEGLMGHGLFDRVHVSDRPAYLSALADAALGRGSGALDFRARRSSPEGRDDFIWIEMRCRRLAAEAGAQGDAGSDVVAVMRDVTDRKRQEEIAAAARHEAEEANMAKGRFLATMSHELRTPLNAVIGFSEMLTKEEEMQIDAEKRREYAGLIHDSGQHLLGVVNLVLDMSKIETGHFVINPEQIAPAPAIRNCCDLLALKARESGIDIAFRLPADLPDIVADKRALKQMLLNLLSNAIKFTDSGGRVTVSATAAGRGDGQRDGQEIAIVVEDTGVGISEADLPRVGDAFFQARNSYDRPYDGTGLGLSIVKGLAELHGGRLEVRSRLGVGTAVTLRLPLDCESGKVADRSVVTLAQPAQKDKVSTAAVPASGLLRAEVKKRA